MKRKTILTNFIRKNSFTDIISIIPYLFVSFNAYGAENYELKN